MRKGYGDAVGKDEAQEREAAKKPVLVITMLRIISSALRSEIRATDEDSWGWEMAQWVHKLMCKREVLSWDLRIPHKSLPWQPAPVIPDGEGKCEQEETRRSPGSTGQSV